VFGYNAVRGTVQMTQITEAIYADGVLRPVEALNLPERQRVRIILEPINGSGTCDRSEAMARLRAGIARMDFRLQSPLPSRDELHDRT
jgi:predicted DNA-binding antitoxin AbrB/MazE fold protein